MYFEVRVAYLAWDNLMEQPGFMYQSGKSLTEALKINN